MIAFLHPREALAALPRLDAGVIVTDYEMPELNGFEFMTEAAKLVPSANFILISGHPITAAIEEKMKASPAKSFLAKPFTWRKLCDEIVQHWPTASLNPFGANPTPVAKPRSVANPASV